MHRRAAVSGIILYLMKFSTCFEWNEIWVGFSDWMLGSFGRMVVMIQDIHLLMAMLASQIKPNMFSEKVTFDIVNIVGLLRIPVAHNHIYDSELVY